MKKILLYIALALLPLTVVAAKPLTQSEVLSQISAACGRITSMQCDFTQTKSVRMLNEKVVSTGRMYYQSPDRLRWEYLKPYRYSFLLNGNKITIKSGSRTDAIDVDRNKMFREIVRVMMNTVVGKCLADSRDFTAAVTGDAAVWIVTLTPRKGTLKQMFRSVVLRFDRTTQRVTQVEMIELKGDRTVIELTNIKSNIPIDASVFEID